MRPGRRLTRWVALVAFAAAVLAAQGVAAGALSGVSASLATQSGGTGAQSVSTPPGGVLSARVIANATGSSKWRATSWQIGPNGDCADHSDQSGSGKSATFNVTAPGTPGDYGATFTPRGDNNCGGEQGTPVSLVNGVRVTAPAPNPKLKSECGLNVMFILDKSGSIGDSADDVRNAARAFLTGLSGTGSKVSIIDFSTSANRPIDYTTVTPQTINDVFNPYLQNQYKPNGWTNWEDAFQLTREANEAHEANPADPTKPLADLVVFITDGDPTARNDPPHSPVTNLPEGEAYALQKATAQADIVKSQGSHIFAIGVGAAVTKPTSAARLTAVSGPNQYPATAFESADYTLVTNFADLADQLRQIATALCSSSVTVTKQVDEADGNGYRVASGWSFTTSLTVSEGHYKSVPPSPDAAHRAAGRDDERRRRGHVPVEALERQRHEHGHDQRGARPRLPLRVRGRHLPEGRIHRARPDQAEPRDAVQQTVALQAQGVRGVPRAQPPQIGQARGAQEPPAGHRRRPLQPADRRQRPGHRRGRRRDHRRGGRPRRQPHGGRVHRSLVAAGEPRRLRHRHRLPVPEREWPGGRLGEQVAGPLNVPVAKDDDIVCTVTNQRRGTIQILKQRCRPALRASPSRARWVTSRWPTAAPSSRPRARSASSPPGPTP